MRASRNSLFDDGRIILQKVSIANYIHGGGGIRRSIVAGRFFQNAVDREGF
jgi:hypothetical protein